jgi:hypothetical protein
MNTKSALAIVAAALACLSVAWAATAPQGIHYPIDGSIKFTCNGASILLFNGAIPPNGFTVQPNNADIVVNDNGPAAYDFGTAAVTGFFLSYSNRNVLTTGAGYKPMGPVSVFPTQCNGTAASITARAW